MEDLLLLPLADYWWAYAGFITGLLLILAFDLGVFSKPGTLPTLRSAIIRSICFVLLALAFNYGLYQFLLYELPNRLDLVGLDHAQLARDTSLEFLAGYVVEYALAIDNVFVFVAVFSYFAVPPQYQQKVLFTASWARSSSAPCLSRSAPSSCSTSGSWQSSASS
jgi:tellurite resistance protein TerC